MPPATHLLSLPNTLQIKFYRLNIKVFPSFLKKEVNKGVRFKNISRRETFFSNCPETYPIQVHPQDSLSRIFSCHLKKGKLYKQQKIATSTTGKESKSVRSFYPVSRGSPDDKASHKWVWLISNGKSCLLSSSFFFCKW